ncbi:MAG TPA: glutamate--tRNA ligase family protein [Gemmataceae bacterium]|nr:glutamate--tRNA ligase family protein [Gemmataceae bacterium]
MTIRTRFAPSPTGYLHIGGVRTALFNWLLAKRLGGKFILRIDDTDKERNRPEALLPILEGFQWLGIQWDEGPEVGGPHAPYFQGQRDVAYTSAAMKLLEGGHAYPDYLTKEEIDAEKKAAEAAKRAYVHRGPHRDTPAAENLRLYRERPTALRFKIPLGREAVFEDLVCGRCAQKTDLTTDPVIIKADGTALYNFASVVDDIEMKITHVIRAKEHLNNAYTQVLIWEALGADLPKMAHIPIVNEPAPKPGAKYPAGVKPPNKNKKLSKRDMAKFVTPLVREQLHAIGWTDEQIDARDDLNPATVAFYREMGYLPEGLINYLGRLGWSLDDKTEFMTLNDMIANFSLERVTDSPASFDPDKLYWLAGEHMKVLPIEQKIAGCIPFLVRANLVREPLDAVTSERLHRVVEAMGDRLHLFSDILLYAPPFLKADPEYDPKAVEDVLKKPGAADLLGGAADALEKCEPFDAATTEQALVEFANSRGIKPGPLNQPLRVAVTGVTRGPGVFETLAIFGKDEVLRRIKLALARI